MRKNLVVASVLGGAAVLFGLGSQAQAVLTLGDLLVPGATVTSGDKTFSNFQGYANSGIVVPASSIAVTPTVIGGEPGLIFQSVITQPPGGITDIHFQYQVTAAPGWLIDDLTGSITAAASGPGASVTMIEVATNLSGVNLAVGTSLTQTKHITFTPTQSLTISKDIALNGGSGTSQGDGAFLSDFTQTFSQVSTVPEPVSAGLSVLALGALGVFATKRHTA